MPVHSERRQTQANGHRIHTGPVITFRFVPFAIVAPGSREGLPLPRPLRTVQASFPAHGSSLTNARCRTRFWRRKRLPGRPLPDTHGEPTPAYHGEAAPAGNCPCRHLLCLLGRLALLSREARPEGSQPAFAPGNVAPRIRPITGQHSLSPSSFTRTAFSQPYGLPTPRGALRAYRVPQE
jgi:hypothetical protein